MNEVIYTPGYKWGQVAVGNDYGIKGRLTDKKMKQLNVFLTNIDKNSCFIFIDKRVKIKGRVRLDFFLKGQIFTQEGVLMTGCDGGRGYGIRFIENSSSLRSMYNWNDFYEIMRDRGFYS